MEEQVLFIGQLFPPAIEDIEPEGIDYIVYQWPMANNSEKVVVFQASHN